MSDDLTQLRSICQVFTGINGLHSSPLAPPAGKTEGLSTQLFFTFSRNDVGICDRKTVEQCVLKVKAKALPDSTLPDSTDVGYRLSARQLSGMVRALSYASSHRWSADELTRENYGTPLPVLIGNLLQAFEQEFRRAMEQDAFVSLPVYANCLSHLGENPLGRRELKKQAVLSDRVLKVILRDLEMLSLLISKKSTAQRSSVSVMLTPLGMAAKAKSQRVLDRLEQSWTQNHTGNSFSKLRELLTSLVDQQELEYPRHLTGYGPMDPALTGGDYVAAKTGPPYIPGRGQEWPVVLKKQKDKTLATFPELMSKTLMQFDIDYNAKKLGNLFFTSRILDKIPDSGQQMKEVEHLFQGVATGALGKGKSYLERHLYLAVDSGRASDLNRVVHPSPKARGMRDTYPASTMEIEKMWRERYGMQVVTQLRSLLEDLVTGVNEQYREFPEPCQWIWELAAAREYYQRLGEPPALA